MVGFRTMYAGYDFASGFTAINQNMFVNALDNATFTESIEKENTPFSTWEFPNKVIKLQVRGHCDLYCMPVDKDVILTAWDDSSLANYV